MWQLFVHLSLLVLIVSEHQKQDRSKRFKDQNQVMETPYYSKHIIEEQTKTALTPINIKSTDPLWQTNVYKGMQSVEYQNSQVQNQPSISEKDIKYEDVLAGKSVGVDAVYFDDRSPFAGKSQNKIKKNDEDNIMTGNRVKSIDEIVEGMKSEILSFQQGRGRSKFLR